MTPYLATTLGTWARFSGDLTLTQFPRHRGSQGVGEALQSAPELREAGCWVPPRPPTLATPPNGEDFTLRDPLGSPGRGGRGALLPRRTGPRAPRAPCAHGPDPEAAPAPSHLQRRRPQQRRQREPEPEPEPEPQPPARPAGRARHSPAAAPPAPRRLRATARPLSAETPPRAGPAGARRLGAAPSTALRAHPPASGPAEGQRGLPGRGSPWRARPSAARAAPAHPTPAGPPSKRGAQSWRSGWRAALGLCPRGRGFCGGEAGRRGRTPALVQPASVPPAGPGPRSCLRRTAGPPPRVLHRRPRPPPAAPPRGRRPAGGSGRSLGPFSCGLSVCLLHVSISYRSPAKT